MEAYNQAIDFMQFMRKFIFSITVGEDKKWKPWQAALILNVNSVLRLQAYFLDVQGFKYVLTARLTQDCVENLFSQIRIRQKKPSALQVKNILKNICVAQLLDDVKGSSYDYDDREWLVDFSSIITTFKPQDKHNPPADVKKKIVPILDTIGLNAFYHVAGNILGKTLNNCEKCVKACTGVGDDVAFAEFTREKDFTGHSLIYANRETFNFMLELDTIFRSYIDQFREENNIFDKMLPFLSQVQASHFSDCHDMRTKLIRRFLSFQLKTLEPKVEVKVKLDSRSMF